MLRPRSFLSAVMSPAATIVMCWSLIFSGIFTGGILKVWLLSPPKTGEEAMATTKMTAAEIRLEKLRIGQLPAELCAIFCDIRSR